MAKNTGKVREKSGNFVSLKKWEPCSQKPPRQRLPWTETPYTDTPWTELPLTHTDRDPPDRIKL